MDNLHFGHLYIDEKDGFSTSEVEFYQDQIKIMDENVKDYLTNSATTPIERYTWKNEVYFIHLLNIHYPRRYFSRHCPFWRCLTAAQYCGLSWEADFWRVLVAVISAQRNSFSLLNHASSASKDTSANVFDKSNDNNNGLDLRFDLACEHNSYACYQKERLRFHEGKCHYETSINQNSSNVAADEMVIFKI